MRLAAGGYVAHHLVVLEVDRDDLVVVIGRDHGVAPVGREEGVMQHAADLGQLGHGHVGLVGVDDPDLARLAQRQGELVVDPAADDGPAGRFNELAVRIFALQVHVLDRFQRVRLQDGDALGHERTDGQPLAVVGQGDAGTRQADLGLAHDLQ